MPATAEELRLVRRAIVDPDSATFSDEEIQETWADAEDQHGVTNLRVVRYQTIADLFSELLANSVKLVTYRQNSATENLSDIFKHLEKMRDNYEAKVSAQENKGKSAMRMANTRKMPPRPKEYPRA